MKIDLTTVQNVARLARLEVSHAELHQLQKNLQAILDYVSQLDQLNLDNIEPTAHPFIEAMRLRDDLAQPFTNIEEILENAPARNGHFFKVPRVLSEG